MEDYIQTREALLHPQDETESVYLQTDPLERSLCAFQGKLKDFPQAETENGIQCKDAKTILTDAINSIGRDSDRLRVYNCNKRSNNMAPQYGSIYDVSFPEWSMGSELRSMHPALVLTDNRMRGSDTLVVAPVTSAHKRKDRILHARSLPREMWTDLAWTYIPIVTSPRRNEMSFVDLKQIRAVSPARFRLNRDGTPFRICTLSNDEMAEIQLSIVKYFNLKIVSDDEHRLVKLREAKEKADIKIRKLRDCLISTKFTLEAAQGSGDIDTQASLAEAINDILQALEL